MVGSAYCTYRIKNHGINLRFFYKIELQNQSNFSNRVALVGLVKDRMKSTSHTLNINVFHATELMEALFSVYYCSSTYLIRG